MHFHLHQDCLDAVAGATSFSTSDITSAYNQIPVRKEDIPKTAFVSKYGLHESTTMCFGLTNAPATFFTGPILIGRCECLLQNI